jgi:hypothetical protein
MVQFKRLPTKIHIFYEINVDENHFFEDLNIKIIIKLTVAEFY